jgi:thioredoxin-like negative regulator of GroEL
MANFLRSRLKSAAPICLISVAVFWAACIAARPNPERLARSARDALYRGDTAQADSLIRQALRRAPTSSEVLVAAGEIAVSREDTDAALAFYDGVQRSDSNQHVIVGLGAAGDLLLKRHRFRDAEDRFRHVLALDPRHVVANRRLAALLVMAGRRRESTPYLFELVRMDEIDSDELALLGNVTQVFDDTELIEQLRKLSPDEPGPHLAAARIAMQKNQIVKAADLLRPLVARAPEQWEARINLGKVLVELGSAQEFLDWHSRLPESLDTNPDVLVVRGQFAERQGELDVAVRCYWEALREDADLWQANYQLSWLLTARGDKRSSMFLERSKKLKALNETLKEVLLTGITPGLALAAGQLTESLGRLWEARAWYIAAAKLQADSDLALDGRSRLEQVIDEATPRVVPTANPALSVDFSSFPRPEWRSARPVASDSSSHAARRGSIQFADDAESSGIRFTFYNGDDPTTAGMRLWQSFGGGVAALDFDGDGWPDLYFTQGTDMSAPPGRAQPADRLFRNLGNGTFADVTVQSQLEDSGYGQGLAVGDYDSDGFADLYVANIGRNCLYRSNGDGTFTDVTRLSGLAGEDRWTASCFMADVNGDGLPDIYDVTYLAGRRPFEHLCEDPELHEYRICPPQLFDAEHDRLYVNLGNGAFEEVSGSSGILVPDGKGLGVVAADFEIAGRLDIFVANDMTRNFYFVNETSTSATAPHFREEAVLRGCAYNSFGQGQACMGIAAADADGDGLLDLYVSNFYNEYNILYLQRAGGLFIDGTSQAGLKVPSVGMLGFGTQFLDANLDGWPDLVVANGHVDDYSNKGIPFRMRPQFYVNEGRGRFAEVPQSELGDYFMTLQLGRGLARLDWNRDGREDFAVSHLETPASLVTNQSSGVGRWVAIQLRGVSSNRDAVGAVVWLTAGGRTQMQQITAGDGYYASNQRQLIFGLGDCDTIDALLVRWPSGKEQQFDPIPPGGEHLLIEDRASPIRLPPANRSIFKKSVISE